MTNEEKQELIEAAHKWIEVMQRYIDNHPQDISAPITLGLYKVALSALSAQPVLYALRFKNQHGQPDKLINENCLFRSHEKASQYGKGGNYVTQASGKIERVPNPQLDPEVVPLYSAPSFSD